MTDDIIAQAIAAARHADAIMRRTAADFPPESPHDDWQPKYKNDTRGTILKWHPPYGETHVKYNIFQLGGGRNPIIWGANHHGTYQGTKTVSSPLGYPGDPEFDVPVYSHSDEVEQLGRFRKPEQAKAAAEEHYRQNYGTPPKHDYDIDSIMNDPIKLQQHSRGLGDDEDYSRIFDAVRRALKKAAAALRKTASHPDDIYDEDGNHVGPTWPADLAHHLQTDPNRASYDAGYHAAWHPAFRDHPNRIDAAESAWSEAGGKRLHSEVENATFEDGWLDSVSEIPHKFLDPAAHESHLAEEQAMTDKFHDDYHTKQIKKHFDPYPDWNPDDKQDPFDPRLIGANKTHECPQCGKQYDDWQGYCKHCDYDEGTLADHHDGIADEWWSDPDEHQDPFDPRIIGAGLHARLAAQASAVDQGVVGRIAAEMSPPCPDCGQVAGFDEHMVSPSVKVCRNCDYPMLDYGVQNLLDRTLSGHDQAIADLPETDHPTLGKHGALEDEPMPDDPNQLEMFTPVPVKPDPRWSGNAILCRNCGHPKSHHGYGARKMGPCPTNWRNDGILPRTRWANLGKHGARPRKPKNPFGSDPAHSYATTCSECLAPIYGHPDDIATKNPKASWVDAQNNDGAEDETHGHHYHWPEELAAW